jgi:hypothetical protein
MSSFLKIVIFTAVEVVGLVAWLILAGLPFQGHVEAVIVLFAVLLVEHIFSHNTGRGRPLISFPE